MSEHLLSATTRTVSGKKTYVLRESGKIPAVVYGANTEPIKITVEHLSFKKTYQQAGESTVVELSVDEKAPMHVLIQDFQLDPVTDDVTHVDFRSIDMNKEIEATIELEFVGEAPAVKALGGTFLPSMDSVKVRCLPNKLVRSISVDISSIKTFEDLIHVSDIIVPEGMIIEDEPTMTIATVAPPRSEAEMADLNKVVEVDVAAVEVEAKEKEEEEEATPEEEK